MPFPITYTPETLALGDKPKFVSATDGDTPSIEVPIRMLGIDAPELHFASARESNPSAYDAQLEGFLANEGAGFPSELRDHLTPYLIDNPSTRHIQAGKAASDHFKHLVETRLKRVSSSTGRELTPRRLFTKVSSQVFDGYGRMLAYLAPAYTRAEREAIPLSERPTFNLQMIEDGHATSLIIYPNIPKPADLELVRKATRKARQYRRGIWDSEIPQLHAFEFRWIIDVIRGRKDGPTRFCGDMTTGTLYIPTEYHNVPAENRIWFFEADVGHAYEMGFRLAQ